MLKEVKNQGDMLKGTIDALTGAHLSSAEAQHQVEASLHTAQAAQANYNTFVNKGTEATLAGKQAHDASVSAWDAHKTAVQFYTAAQTAETQAQTKAHAATKAALQPLLAYAAGFDKNTRGHEAAIPALACVAIANKLTLGWIGTAHSSEMLAEFTRKRGIATQQAGQQAFTAAIPPAR